MVTSSTAAFGSPVPSRDQLVAQSPAHGGGEHALVGGEGQLTVHHHERIATAMSGRLPEMSVHDSPPLWVSKTWPMPPPGIQRRE